MIITSVIKISTNMNASALVCIVPLAQSPPVEGPASPLLASSSSFPSLLTTHPQPLDPGLLICTWAGKVGSLPLSHEAFLPASPLGLSF